MMKVSCAAFAVTVALLLGGCGGNTNSSVMARPTANFPITWNGQKMPGYAGGARQQAELKQRAVELGP